MRKALTVIFLLGVIGAAISAIVMQYQALMRPKQLPPVGGGDPGMMQEPPAMGGGGGSRPVTLGPKDAKVVVVAAVPLGIDCHEKTVQVLRRLAQEEPKHLRVEICDMNSPQGQSQLSKYGSTCASVFVNGKSEFTIKTEGKPRKILCQKRPNDPDSTYNSIDLIDVVDQQLEEKYGSGLGAKTVAKLKKELSTGPPKATGLGLTSAPMSSPMPAPMSKAAASGAGQPPGMPGGCSHGAFPPGAESSESHHTCGAAHPPGTSEHEAEVATKGKAGGKKAKAKVIVEAFLPPPTAPIYGKFIPIKKKLSELAKRYSGKVEFHTYFMLDEAAQKAIESGKVHGPCVLVNGTTTHTVKTPTGLRTVTFEMIPDTMELSFTPEQLEVVIQQSLAGAGAATEAKTGAKTGAKTAATCGG